MFETHFQRIFKGRYVTDFKLSVAYTGFRISVAYTRFRNSIAYTRFRISVAYTRVEMIPKLFTTELSLLDEKSKVSRAMDVLGGGLGAWAPTYACPPPRRRGTQWGEVKRLN